MNGRLFVILLDRIPGKDTPRDVVRSHIDHLKRLDEQGVLVMCGPFEDYPGGMVIVRARDASEAAGLANLDPFVATGIRTFEVRTWQLATAENNFLG